MNSIYEIPNNIRELFENGETSYRIIDYSPEMEMDNYQSMNYFIKMVGINEDCIEENHFSQIIIKHEDFNFKIQVDSGGLGDFFSHGFDVTILEDEKPDYFVCISPTEEERNKRRTEVTTLE